MFSSFNNRCVLCAWSWSVENDRLCWAEDLCALFGLSPDIAPSNWESQARLFTPESFSKLGQATQECLRTGVDYIVDLEALLAEERVLAIQIYGAVRRDECGKVSGISGVVINTTAQNLAAHVESMHLERLEQFINTINDPIYFKDLDSKFLLANRQLIEERGLSDLTDIIGTTDTDFYTSELAAQYRAEEIELMRTGEPMINIEQFQPVDHKGTYRWVAASKVPMRDRNGRIIGLMGISRDISNLKNKEEELTKNNLALKEATEQALSSDRAKGEFLGVMSHELRTPLNGILGFSDLLLQGHAMQSESRDLIGLIKSSAQSLLRILEEILEFIRVQGSELKFESIPFSLSELAQKIIQLVEPDAKAKGIQLSLNLGKGIPSSVVGDEARIEQVLLNLLRNGVKFTHHGTVALSIELTSIPGKQSSILFTVEDTGIGIASDQLEVIFQPFTQGDSSLSRNYDGIGIGLATTRQIIEKMGSKLVLKSNEGEGSSFFFMLPLQASDPPDAEQVQDLDHELGNLNKDFATRFPLRILAVEDNLLNLKLIVRLLGNLGYDHVIKAVSAEEALSLLPSSSVDLIFMDLQMPGMDGIEATREIRLMEASTPSALPINIVALTANVSPAIRAECFAAGMNDYLSKPFNSRQLSQAIAQAFRARSK